MEVVAEASVAFSIHPPASRSSSHGDTSGGGGGGGGEPTGGAGSNGAGVEEADARGSEASVPGSGVAGVKFVSPSKNMSSFLDPRNVSVEVEVVGVTVPTDGSFEVCACVCVSE